MSLLKDYDILYDILYDSFDELSKKSAEDNRFIYIYTKAYLLLKHGPVIYRKNDFFKMPQDSWDSQTIEGVMYGCKQILEGRGLVESNPFVDLGISVFYRLFEVFHYESINRKSKRIKLNGISHFLDIIEFDHCFDESTVTYCNLVKP